MSSGEKIGGDGGGGRSEWDTLTTGDIEKFASSTEEPNYDEFAKRELPKLEENLGGIAIKEEPVGQRFAMDSTPIPTLTPTPVPEFTSETAPTAEQGKFNHKEGVDDLTEKDINKFVASAEAPDYNELVKRELPKLEKDFEGVTVEKEPVEFRFVDGSERSEFGDEPKLGDALYDGDYTPRPSRYYRHNESTPEPTPEPTPVVREYTEQEKAERQRILDKIADIMSEESSTEQQ